MCEKQGYVCWLFQGSPSYKVCVEKKKGHRVINQLGSPTILESIPSSADSPSAIEPSSFITFPLEFFSLFSNI